MYVGDLHMLTFDTVVPPEPATNASTVIKKGTISLRVRYLKDL